MSVKITISRIKTDHLAGCLALIHELAEYEKAPQEVEVDLEKLKSDFEENAFKAFVALDESANVVGMALYYPIYSTWKGKSIHLEDLIVKTNQRRKGIGKLLFNRLVEEAKNQNVGRLQWQVLDWNKAAIEFYKGYPAVFDGEWLNVKISNKQLQDF